MISMSWVGALALELAFLTHPVPARSEATSEPAAAEASDEAHVPAPATENGDPAATVAPVEPAAAWNPRANRARRGGIESRVRLLTAELQLDPGQQEQVRRILMDQRAAMLRAWSDDSVPSAVRVKATQIVAEQTAERIRAVLNDEQREKYIKPVPLHTTPNPADLERYLNATQRK